MAERFDLLGKFRKVFVGKSLVLLDNGDQPLSGGDQSGVNRTRAGGILTFPNDPFRRSPDLPLSRRKVKDRAGLGSLRIQSEP